MGFFRFRRSIKILPGVRWNFGKRGSSVSFGGRGFHYTIGTHGTRTTVGLPGTGLSYTSTGSSRRQAGPPINADRAAKWGARQEETFHIEIPDREEGEDPATQEQLDSIGDLVKNIQGLDFDALGKKQASTLIDVITAEKDRFTERKIQEYLAIQKRKTHLIAWGIVLVFLMAWIYSSSNRRQTSGDSVAIMPAPRPIQTPAAPVAAPVVGAPILSVAPSATSSAGPSATPLPALAPLPAPARMVTLKTVKTIYPDSGGTKKVDPGTKLKVIAANGSVMTVELNGQTFNVSKSEIIEHT
jgi:Protein of unknown function (DUF4236)